MADNVVVTAGTGTTVAADEVIDGTLGTVKVQYVKLMDGTLDGTTKAGVGANGLKVDGSAVTQPISGSVGLTGTLPAFAATPTVNAAQSGVWNVTNISGTVSLPTGASTAANQTSTQVTLGSTLVNRTALYDGTGTIIDWTADSGVFVKPRATANGTTSTRVMSAATTNATSVKASAGQVYQIDVFNTNTYDVFLKFYNKASAPTVGTDTPVWTIPIKAGTGYSREFVQGKSFSVGIAYAITKVLADSDTTVVAVNDLVGAVDWI